jgi:hypothetical protein
MAVAMMQQEAAPTQERDVTDPAHGILTRSCT